MIKPYKEIPEKIFSYGDVILIALMLIALVGVIIMGFIK